MKKTRVLLGALALSCLLTVPAYAAEWKQDSTGWWWQEDNGSYPTSTWKNIGGKYYYFGADGYMLHDTTNPDGYKVGSDGAWIEENKTTTTEVKIKGAQPDENGKFPELARQYIWNRVVSDAKSQLKYASTAKFPEASDEEAVKITLLNGEYFVRSYCEARNGYGIYNEVKIQANVIFDPNEGYKCDWCILN